MAKIKTAIFPIAGLGTRFLPATKAIPKEMLVVVDKPLIQYAVEEAKEAGIERFIFVTSQGKAAIEDHFDACPVLEEILLKRSKTEDLKKLKEVQLDAGCGIFIRQQHPKGLGHAVACAHHLVDEEAFAVVLADDLVLGKQGCLKQMIESYDDKDGNMVAVVQIPREETLLYGILDIEQIEGKKVRSKGIVEKPEPKNAPSQIAVSGRYILRKSLFKKLHEIKPGISGEIQLTDALQESIKEIPLTGFLYDGFRYDCGTKTGWLEANIAFSLNNQDTREETLEILKKLIR